MQAQPAVKKKIKSVSYSHWGYIFIAPFFIVFLIFQLYPIFFTFRTSLTDAMGWEKILNNNIIGLENFRQLFDSSSLVFPKFWGALGNTMIMWFFNFVPQLGFALILASWFTDSRLHLKGQGFFKTTIFMPNIITAATIGMLFMSLFAFPVAPINTFLQTSGIVNMPVNYFRSVEWSRGLISFIQWWMWCGQTLIMLMAGITSISPSLYESAVVDGATQSQQTWYITLPLLRPMMLFLLVTSIIGGMQLFEIPFLLTDMRGGPDYRIRTMVLYMYNTAFQGVNKYGYASAIAMGVFIITMFFSALVFFFMQDRSEPKAKK